MKKLEISENDKILIIAPHPDDECIGVGGLLALYADQCSVWILTDGSKCKLDKTEDEIIKIREKELCDAMSFLGIKDIRLFRAKDRSLREKCNLLDGEKVGEFTKIFIPSNNEKHEDHIASYYIAIGMLKMQEKCESDIYIYEITHPMNDSDLYIDITDVIEKKRNAIKRYKSQLEIFDYEWAALSINRFRACMIGLKESYIEVFKKLDLASYRKENDQRYLLEIKDIIISNLTRMISIVSNKDKFGMFFECSDFESINIYGYGVLGKCLYEALSQVKVEIKSIIDQRFSVRNGVFCSVSDALKDDLTVVTVVRENEKVCNELKLYGFTKIITLDRFMKMIEEFDEVEK